MNEQDRRFLTQAVDLAEEAVDAGDEPFGSVLVDGAGEVLQVARNEAVHRNATLHPELTLAQWAGDHLDASARAAATVYTSGEHCAMCAAAHGLAGLGRIVYATSTLQLAKWLDELGRPSLGIAPLRITDVVPGARVDGPVTVFADEVRSLHARAGG